MTHDTIEQIIDALNQGQMRDRIFRSKLSPNVDFAKVWVQYPQGGIANEGSYDFFFIKNENGVYVGAVLDMIDDLHAFVKEASRKRGYLKTAMNETILPMLYQSGRKKQHVTFNDSSMGNYCVKHLGFTILSESEAEKDLSIYSDFPHIIASGAGLSLDEFKDIHIKIGRIQHYLTMIQEQLELSYEKCNDFFIDEIKKELSDLEIRIEEFIKSRNNLTSESKGKA